MPFIKIIIWDVAVQIDRAWIQKPALQPPGQVDVAAGISKHQYVRVECLDNTGSVRSRLNHPVIHTPCCDRLFLGMVGHYVLIGASPEAGKCPLLSLIRVLLAGKKTWNGRWRWAWENEEEASLPEPCRHFGGHASGHIPKSWKAHLEAAQDREKLECFQPLETTELLFLYIFFGVINCCSIISSRVFCWKITTETLVPLCVFILLGLKKVISVSKWYFKIHFWLQ